MFFHNNAILIETGILVETMKLFNQKAKKLLKLEPSKLSIIFCFISILFAVLGSFSNGPYEFVWYNYEQSGNSSIQLIKHEILFHGPNDFGKSKIGFIYYVTYLSIFQFFLFS